MNKDIEGYFSECPTCNKNMNRNKDFLKDNSLPSANSNLLKMDCSNFLKEEYYLWAWAEIYLRYKSISKLKKIMLPLQMLRLITKELFSYFNSKVS